MARRVKTTRNHLLPHASCPFYDPLNRTCQASCSSMAIDRKRQATYCASEDHDDCPLFLARFLRSHRLLCFDIPRGEFESK